jgi:hypothetical protein
MWPGPDQRHTLVGTGKNRVGKWQNQHFLRPISNQVWTIQCSSTQNPLKDSNLIKTVWEEIIDYAEMHNEPGAFTAFIG